MRRQSPGGANRVGGAKGLFIVSFTQRGEASCVPRGTLRMIITAWDCPLHGGVGNRYSGIEIPGRGGEERLHVAT